MSDVTTAPDISRLDIPMDRWTQPFWDNAARGELTVPQCGSCGAFRWPPGPYCPECRAQEVHWVAAGPAVLYSFTVVRRPGPTPDDPPTVIAPGLVAFPQAGGVRIMAAIVDTPVEAIRIDVPLTLHWRAHGDTRVPVFSIG